jgi:hypothetical protein
MDQKPNTWTCEDVRQAASNFTENDVGSEKGREMVEHVEKCGHCLSFFVRYHDALPEGHMNSAIANALFARIKEKVEKLSTS